jgi:hypothetical protein
VGFVVDVVAPGEFPMRCGFPLFVIPSVPHSVVRGWYKGPACGLSTVGLAPYRNNMQLLCMWKEFEGTLCPELPTLRKKCRCVNVHPCDASDSRHALKIQSISSLMGDEVTGSLRQLHNEELLFAKYNYVE